MCVCVYLSVCVCVCVSMWVFVNVCIPAPKGLFTCNLDILSLENAQVSDYGCRSNNMETIYPIQA